MSIPPISQAPQTVISTLEATQRVQPSDVPSDDIGKRFEQLLWAEMLSNAGLEKSLTMNGGESASAFSRYVIEQIAEDIAEKHPLGLSGATQGYTQYQEALAIDNTINGVGGDD